MLPYMAFPSNELFTIADHVRYAVSRFNEAGLFYGHGTDNAFDEAVFIVLESIHLPPDTSLEPIWNCRLTEDERFKVSSAIDARVFTRKPASYITNCAYICGIPFYVDERVIVPRSFIGEILMQDDGFSPSGMPKQINRILDLCTGSGCLAIIASLIYPEAKVDAVDLSPGALEVARKNVKEHGLEDRISLFEGDLFEPLEDRKYDLIITNPPYVDAQSMNELPSEYRHEPEMSLAAGHDGLDLVRAIIAKSPDYLSENGAMICEVGRGKEILEEEYPGTLFLWLDTENSEGNVFCITRKEILK